jgi:2',3'-cyclic-nucleotide 2'-phosphodiesterase (5'-nucleotidase family)
MRLLALLHFRDEAGALPGYFANIAPQVDGIVALDHGSIDGASELAGGEPKLVELLRRPRDAPFDQGLQQRLLTQAGIRNGAD